MVLATLHEAIKVDLVQLLGLIKNVVSEKVVRVEDLCTCDEVPLKACVVLIRLQELMKVSHFGSIY